MKKIGESQQPTTKLYNIHLFIVVKGKQLTKIKVKKIPKKFFFLLNIFCKIHVVYHEKIKLIFVIDITFFLLGYDKVFVKMCQLFSPSLFSTKVKLSKNSNNKQISLKCLPPIYKYALLIPLFYCFI